MRFDHFPRATRHSHFMWLDKCRYGYRRDAESKARRSPSGIGNNLFLVLVNRFCHDVCLISYALGGGLVLVHPWPFMFHNGNFWKNGSSAPLA